MFWLFKKKRGDEINKEEIKNSFDAVKDDFTKVGQWISYFDDNNKKNTDEISDLKKEIFVLQNEIDDIKDFISLFGSKMSKQQQVLGVKQTAVSSVQDVVQTAVQSHILDNLSMMERGIVWALVNSESKKLSYEDLAIILGKEKSTIRGQINTIKQKSDGLIEEYIEPNGKKRVFIPEEMRQIILKKEKVRVKSRKKVKNN